MAVGVGVGFGYYPYFYSPFYFSPFYSPYYWGWYPFWGYPPYGYGYGYGGPAFSDARLQMKPVDADVYVDNYYVGRVDDFDGIFQRLDLPPGEHEIIVYRDGYKTYRYKNLFRPGEGYKVQAALEPLAQGEAQEPRPQAPPRSADQQPAGPPSAYPGGPESGRTVPLPDRRGSDRLQAQASGFGTLAIRVQPADAVVTIDGERWDSPEGGSRLQLQLAAGRHQIEVRKDGFKPYSTSVEIHAGETQNVNVSLPSSGGI